jgi:hypothetical protein
MYPVNTPDFLIELRSLKVGLLTLWYATAGQ